MNHSYKRLLSVLRIDISHKTSPGSDAEKVPVCSAGVVARRMEARALNLCSMSRTDIVAMSCATLAG